MNYVDQAYEKCRIIIEEHSKSFAKAFGALPLPKRKAIWAVYAFCRRVDDIVDENGGSLQELYKFEKQFKKFLENSIPLNDFMWIALKDVFTQFEMDSVHFFAMIQGQKMDFERATYQTIDQLESYSYHVASTVGLMLLPILAPSNHHELKEGAVELGLAMQLTNILRDVGEDLEKGRIYIPKELMDQYGYDIEELLTHQVNNKFIQLWESISSRADEYYENAMKTINRYPDDAKFSVLASLYFYREILNSVRNNDYDVFTKRAYVTDEQKHKIVYKLMMSNEALA